MLSEASGLRFPPGRRALGDRDGVSGLMPSSTQADAQARQGNLLRLANSTSKRQHHQEMDAPTESAALLPRVRGGELEATERLTELLYGELRRLANAALSGGRQSLQPTELVHEVFVRLTRGTPECFESRAHFLAVAATAMRHVLIDRARRRNAKKRGDGQRVVTLDTGRHLSTARKGPGALELELALSRLHAIDPRAVEVFVYRVYGGMQVAEIAEVLNVSNSTVERSFRSARAWLTRELVNDDST